MTNIEKIRQEIERRAKFHDNAMKACTGLNNIALTHSAGWKEDTELLAFIDSLPEEACKDSLQAPETCKENTDSFTSLEEVAEEYATMHLRNNEFPTADSAFKAGAEWMANRRRENTLNTK